MAKNDFLAKLDEQKQNCFVAGCEITAQQMFDMMCLVLNDPEIMGKDVFGENRLLKVHDAMVKRESYFHDAWIFNQESDYYQEKLDAELKKIFGTVVPFKERYKHIREWNYNKPMKKG